MKHIYRNIQGWFDYKTFYQCLIDEMPQGFNFAEIGVWKGKSLSCFLVSCINKKKKGTAYAVDTWLGNEEQRDRNSPSYQDILEKGGLFELFLDNVRPFKNLHIIRKESEHAAVDFPNSFFDAVFIDASHDYENVKKDMDKWFPKVKSGGVMSGHDYTKDSVARAVKDFAKDNDLAVSDSLRTDEKARTNRNVWIVYRP